MSAAPTAQNIPELHFCFINSFIQPSHVGSLPPPLSNSQNLAKDQALAALPPVAALRILKTRLTHMLQPNPIFLKTFEGPEFLEYVAANRLFSPPPIHMPVGLGRAVVQGCVGCAMAHPDFGRSGNPISTGGTDYAHLITTGTSGFSDLPTALRLLTQASQLTGTSSYYRF